MSAGERRWRRGSAVFVTLYLAQCVASPFEPVGHVMNFPWPMFVVLFVPTMAGVAALLGFMVGWALVEFYKWALGGPSPETVAERIAKLERELGIGQ